MDFQEKCIANVNFVNIKKNGGSKTKLKELMLKNFVSISFVFTIIILIVCCTTATVLFAFTVYQSNALYGEDCIIKKCNANLNLACINGKCNCNPYHYYDKICYSKKRYFEKCNNISYVCMDNANLICQNGVCKCDDASTYWNGKYCQLKNAYNGPCDNDFQCLTNTLLYCDTKKMKCMCQENSFWDGYSCWRKRTVNETCVTTSNCNLESQLICVKKTCQCFNKQVWNSNLQKCVTPA